MLCVVDRPSDTVMLLDMTELTRTLLTLLTLSSLASPAAFADAAAPAAELRAGSASRRLLSIYITRMPAFCVFSALRGDPQESNANACGNPPLSFAGRPGHAGAGHSRSSKLSCEISSARDLRVVSERAGARELSSILDRLESRRKRPDRPDRFAELSDDEPGFAIACRTLPGSKVE